MTTPTQPSVLVADDYPIFAELASACLENLGIKVDVATDGAEAIGALDQKSYDVIVVDLSMPKIDGFRLISMIRHSPKLDGLQIIVASSHGDKASVEEAGRLGATAFLTKPVDWKVFAATVSAAVEATQ